MCLYVNYEYIFGCKLKVNKGNFIGCMMEELVWEFFYRCYLFIIFIKSICFCIFS